MPYPKPPAPIKPQENKWFNGDLPFQNSDEYRERYITHPIPVNTNFKPVHQPIQSGKFAAATENQDTYVKHSVKNREKPNPKPNEWSRREAAPFEGHSESDEAYKPWPVQVRWQPPKQVYSMSKEDREFKTTVSADYVPHHVEKRKGRPPAKWIPTEGQFNGESINKSDYQSWKGAVRAQPIKPSFTDSLTHPAKFEGNTESQDTYKSWPTPRRPQKHLTKYVPSEAKFEGISTQKDDFRAVKAARAQPIKPSYIDSLTHPATFEGNTESQDTYKPWPTPKRPQKHLTKYVPSEAKFEGLSTQKDDFRAIKAARAQPIKPSYIDSLTHPAVFEGVTENQDSYTSWPTPKRPQKHLVKYVPPEAKFEGLSTQKADYAGFNKITLTKSFRPQLQYKPGTEDRDFLSETKAKLRDFRDEPATAVSAQKHGAAAAV